ncbi:hypothetical protein Q5P01_012009 [Channa striata]|uniref:Uncharacterized protein n=1 Tax=Channa striata TaxID=64152 RepID=A0AA88SQL8_CHASR|nr:hypothetical protein Q5P01_012009 [Channa striata]
MRELYVTTTLGFYRALKRSCVNGNGELISCWKEILQDLGRDTFMAGKACVLRRGAGGAAHRPQSIDQKEHPSRAVRRIVRVNHVDNSVHQEERQSGVDAPVPRVTTKSNLSTERAMVSVTRAPLAKKRFASPQGHVDCSQTDSFAKTKECKENPDSREEARHERVDKRGMVRSEEEREGKETVSFLRPFQTPTVHRQQSRSSSDYDTGVPRKGGEEGVESEDESWNASDADSTGEAACVITL